MVTSFLLLLGSLLTQEPLPRRIPTENAATSLAFSQDGKMLATCHDNELQLWHPETSAHVLRVTSERERQRAVQFSPDGSTLAVATDNKIVLRAVATGRVSGQMLAHTAPVIGLSWSADGKVLVSWGEDRSVRAWDVASRRQKSALEGMKGVPASAAASPDGSRFAVAVGNTLALVDAATGEIAVSFSDPSVVGGATAVAFRAKTGELVSAGGACLAIWESASGKLVRRGLPGIMAKHLFCLADGARAVVVAQEGDVVVADLDTAAAIGVLLSRRSTPHAAAASPDGRLVALSIPEPAVSVWNLESQLCRVVAPVVVSEINGRRVLRPTETGIDVVGVDDGRLVYTFPKTVEPAPRGLSGNGKRAFAVDPQTKALVVYDAESGRRIGELKDAYPPQVGLNYLTEDGKLLAVGAVEGQTLTVTLRSVDTGETIATLPGLSMGLKIALSPNRQLAVTGGEDGVVRLWKLSTGKEAISFEAKRAVLSLKFLTDSLLLLARDDGVLRVVQIPTCEEVQTFPGYGGEPSSDGKYVLVSSDRQYFRWRVVELGTGRTVAFEARSRFAWGPDGRLLAATPYGIARFDHTLIAVRVLTGLTGELRGLYASPSAPKIATVVGREVQVWDADAGVIEQRIPTEAEVGDVIFHPDGKRLVIACNGKQFIWHLEKKIVDRPLRESPSYGKFLPDNKSFVTINSGGVRFLNLETDSQDALVPLRSAMGGISVSRDGRRALVRTNEGYAVIDLKARKESKQVKSAGFEAAWLLGDGKTALANFGMFSAVIDVDTGKEVRRLPVRGCHNVAVRADGKLAAFGFDAGIALISPEKGTVVRMLPGTRSTARIAFSSDGLRLFVPGLDIQVWEVPP